MTDKDPFTDALRRRLRQQEDDLAPSVNQRLRQAREQAVQAAQQPAATGTPGWQLGWPQLAGAGAFVAAVLWSAMVFISTVEPLPQMDDEDMLVASEVELLEDLEFIAWVVAMETPDA